MTCDVKTVLNKKKAAFRSRDKEVIKTAQRELKQCLKEAKESYRRKVEHKLMENNMREVWDGVKIITGHKAKNSTEGGTVERANQLNIFFNRFDQPSPLPPSQGTNIMAPSLSPRHVIPPSPHHWTPLSTPLLPISPQTPQWTLLPALLLLTRSEEN